MRGRPLLIPELPVADPGCRALGSRPWAAAPSPPRSAVRRAAAAAAAAAAEAQARGNGKAAARPPAPHGGGGSSGGGGGDSRGAEAATAAMAAEDLIEDLERLSAEMISRIKAPELARRARRMVGRRCGGCPACRAGDACGWCGGCGEGRVYTNDARMGRVAACAGCIWNKCRAAPTEEEEQEKEQAAAEAEVSAEGSGAAAARPAWLHMIGGGPSHLGPQDQRLIMHAMRS